SRQFGGSPGWFRPVPSLVKIVQGFLQFVERGMSRDTRPLDGGYRRAMENRTDATDHDEFHLMQSKAAENETKIRGWGWHRVTLRSHGCFAEERPTVQPVSTRASSESVSNQRHPRCESVSSHPLAAQAVRQGVVRVAP